MFWRFCSGRHIETVMVCSKYLNILNFIKSSESLRNPIYDKMREKKKQQFSKEVASF